MKRSSLVCVALAVFVAGCQTQNSSNETKAAEIKLASPSYGFPGYQTPSATSHDKAGRYEGWVVTPSERYPVTFDLLDSPTPDLYQGILSLVFGGTESVAFHLEARQTGDELRIDHQFLSISGLHVNDKRMSGRLMTRFESQSGDLVLVKREGRQQDAPAWEANVMTVPVGSPLAGHYDGACGEQEAVLQVEAFPWRHFNAETALDWFDHVQVRARIAKPDDLLCGAGSVCVQRNFTSARVFVLDGKLELQGRSGTVACTRSGGDELVCGDCQFRKQIAGTAEVMKSWPTNKAVLDMTGPDRLPQTAVDASGHYFGYLHHEGRDSYQLIALNVEAQMEHDILQGQAVITAYLGEGDSSEFSVFRFDDFALPQRGLITWDGGADPLLRIERWSDGLIRGLWFSKSHGRIGAFHLIRDGVPQLPTGLSLEASLSGGYVGDEAQFAMLVNPEIADETSSLFPLRVIGNVIQTTDESRRRRIDEMRYNVYLGSIGIVLDDGRLITGRRQGDGFAMIWPPGPRFGQNITPWEPRRFDQKLESRPHASK